MRVRVWEGKGPNGLEARVSLPPPGGNGDRIVWPLDVEVRENGGSWRLMSLNELEMRELVMTLAILGLSGLD